MIVPQMKINSTQITEPIATARIVSAYLERCCVGRLARLKKWGLPMPVLPIARIEALNLSSGEMAGS